MLPLQTALAVYEAEDPYAESLRLFQESALIRAAVLLASPSLHRELQADTIVSSKTLRKLLQYIVRMSSRPMPYGLFASIGYGEIGESDSLGLEAKIETSTRLDALAKTTLLASALESESALHHVRVGANNIVINVGDHAFVFSEGLVQNEGSVYNYTPSVLDISPFWLRAFELAKDGIRRDLLIEQLALDFNATRERVEAAVRRLIDSKLIEFPNAMTCEDNEIFELLPLAQARRIEELLELADKGPLTNKESVYLALVDAVAIPESFNGPIVQVEARRDAVGKLPPRVLEDAKVLAGIFVRCSSTKSLRNLRNQLRARYDDSGEPIPLTDIAVPTSGLELDLALEDTNSRDPNQDRCLLHMAGEALRKNLVTIHLDAAELDRLLPRTPNQIDDLGGFDLVMRLIPLNGERIDTGDYLISPGAIGVAPMAGKSIGRFARLFQPEQIEQFIEPADEFLIDAELVYLPQKIRASNLRGSTTAATYEIRIGNVRAGIAPRTLSLDDLYIIPEQDRLTLWSRSLGCQIRIRETHTLVANTLTFGPAKLLSLLAQEAVPVPTHFNWGSASFLPRLPRLQFGNVIVSRARWSLPTDVSGIKDAELRRRAIRTWRETWSVPRVVTITQFDNRLLLDLDSSVAPDIICDLAKIQGDINLLVEEVPECEESLGPYAMFRGHVADFVLPFVRRSGRKLRKKLTLELSEPAIRNDVIYAKLLTSPLLVEKVLTLLSQRIDSPWFFVRYGDARGFHLRVRVCTISDAERRLVRVTLADIFERLVDQRLIFGHETCNYLPENSRYGGSNRMIGCERIFVADSAEFTSIPEDIRQNPTERLYLALKDALSYLAGSSSEASWAKRHDRRHSLDAQSDQVRRRLVLDYGKSVSSVGKAVSAFEKTFIDDRETRWPSVLSSLVHMHFNRYAIHGIEEDKANLILARALKATLRVPTSEVVGRSI